MYNVFAGACRSNCTCSLDFKSWHMYMCIYIPDGMVATPCSEPYSWAELVVNGIYDYYTCMPVGPLVVLICLGNST